MKRLKLTLGEFLLAGNWVDFPGLGGNSNEFTFAFPSAAARTAFGEKWTGATVVLPNREVQLTSVTPANDGALLLTLKTGASGNSSSLREAIILKLTGKPVGHTTLGMLPCAKRHTGNGTLVQEDIQREVAALIKEGIVELDPHEQRYYYRLADPEARRKAWREC